MVHGSEDSQTYSSGASLYGSLESRLSVSSTVGRDASSSDSWPHVAGKPQLAHGNAWDGRSSVESLTPPSLSASSSSSFGQPSTTGFHIAPSYRYQPARGHSVSDEPAAASGYRQFGVSSTPREARDRDSGRVDVLLSLDSLTLEPYRPRSDSASRSPVGSIGSDRSSRADNNNDALASELLWERRGSWEQREATQVRPPPMHRPPQWARALVLAMLRYSRRCR
jgi:hypothetical protein